MIESKHWSAVLGLIIFAGGCQPCERPGDLQRPAGAPESAEQPFLVRARALHERIITIDSHSDFPLVSCGATDLQVDVPKMRAGGLDAVFEIVFTAQPERTHENREKARRRALEHFQEIHDGIRRCGDAVELARTPEDLEQIVANGKLVVAIGIENGFPIGEDLALLEAYRDLGAAYVGLTHEGHNDLADSANPSDELADGGEAEELPPERRAEFEARLAEQDNHWALATVGHFVDHIDYAVGLVGVDHVGIGSDFSGSGGVAGVTGWSDASETASVTSELLRRGYTEEEIRKAWGGNLLRVWREVRRLAGGGGSTDHGNG